MELSNIFFVAIFIWLLGLSFFLYKTRSHYEGLISRTKKRKIDEVLDTLLESDAVFFKEIDKIKKTIQEIIYHDKSHYQKLGFLRFNPFERVGGDQSFIIALLNAEDSGIIINFLYTREGIRIYSKKIDKGKSEEYDLSAEEKEAIRKAR